MINVLHVSQVGMGVGGTEECIYLLCKYLDKQKFANYIWSPYGGGETLDLLQREKVISGASLAKSAPELTDFIQNSQINIVIVHSGALNMFYILPTLKIFKEGFDLPVIEVMHRPLPSWGAPFGIDRIVAVSEYVATKQKPEYQAITQVIYNGIELDLFDRSKYNKADCRRRLGLPADKLIFGFIGHLAEWKRPQDIIEVARQAAERDGEAFFAIAGDGPLRAFIEKQIAELGLKNIKLLGRVAKSQRTDFFASLDLFLFPSGEEAFALVVLEAMAIGLPVITYNYGSLHEYFDPAQDNYFLAPYKDGARLADIALRLAGDRAAREKLGADNLALSKKFDMRQVAKDYELLISKLAAKEVAAVKSSAKLERNLGGIALAAGETELAKAIYSEAIRQEPGLREGIIDEVNRFKNFLQGMKKPTAN
ncbi:MAG: glycosyltransferase family 4 protein [Candidatus Margulisbacteria bacterium]|nr:glycosyltransferase family 4 protein [Candidatus Margulisiibacteriota bacterium]